MQLLEDDDEVVYSADEDEAKRKADGRPAWMITLHNSAATWLRLVPQSLTSLKRTVENIKDPMYRYFEREVNAAVKLLQIVRRDLEDAIQICKGEKKQTNFHRSMISDLAKGILPSHWRCYTVPSGCTVIQWITDFSDRIKQLQKVSTASTSGGTAALKNLHVWLGGLFNPEAYITATRQYVAQANGWSLEELAMKVTITNKDEKAADLDECSFGVTGLKLQGAECKNSQLLLTLTISAELPLTTLRWIKKTETESTGPEVTLPVYLNTTRSELLFTVNLPVAGQQKEHSFYERGVAVICSSALG